ncbi:MAG: zinc ribbon domain-containing protein [Methanobrevibacter olleyae]|uniref:Zinc ribbon domain-containing protein n=1 Tax=Methanobrevibacter olleyae TaxID=294671 RepID=A0A8T3VSJ2_METOL|nr:zinc ribbon domain-containing protein [Methanobrevibacter olleyae]
MAKFCPECGFEQHNDNNRYCSNCGFDFSKLENDIKSEEDGNSTVIVPIGSDERPVSKPVDSRDSKVNSPSSSASSKASNSKGSSSTKSSGSNAKTTKTYTSKLSDDFLSKITFNKCFLAFTVLLIILLIIGMMVQLDPEPSSDNGLTSFMERSNSYSYSDFMDDSHNYYDDSDSRYLSYGEDNDYANLFEN